MEETWKAIPGFEGWYEASTFGRIRSIKAKSHFRQTSEPIVLTPLVYHKGYLKVRLGGCGKTRKPMRDFIHRIIYRTFHGPIPESLTVNHIDGVNTNNRPQNLELATRLEQIIHAKKLGLVTKRKDGKKVANLSDDNIRQIRDMIKAGISQSKIGKHFGTTKSNIRWIKNGRTWSHVL